MKTYIINMIVAMTKTRIIGNENKLPWNIPDELQYFKKITSNSTVIMGKKTFESIGRPLPNRHNIVLGQTDCTISDIDICTTINEAISIALSYKKDIFVIGGAQTYAQFLPITDRFFVSYIKNEYPGNIYFPNYDFSKLKIIKETDYPDFQAFVYEKYL